jgi:hypothetical protein
MGLSSLLMLRGSCPLVKSHTYYDHPAGEVRRVQSGWKKTINAKHQQRRGTKARLQAK